MSTIEVLPNAVRNVGGRWQLISPLTHGGGGLFAIVAGWCSHCSTLKATVPQAQQIRSFDFFWMDGDRTPEHQEKTQEMGIEGFPTIYTIKKDGFLEPYEGGRSAQDLASNFRKGDTIESFVPMSGGGLFDWGGRRYEHFGNYAGAYGGYGGGSYSGGLNGGRGYGGSYSGGGYNGSRWW